MRLTLVKIMEEEHLYRKCLILSLAFFSHVGPVARNSAPHRKQLGIDMCQVVYFKAAFFLFIALVMIVVSHSSPLVLATWSACRQGLKC